MSSEAPATTTDAAPAEAAATQPQTQTSPPDRRMSSTARTGLFVAGAVLCLAITGMVEWMQRPAEIKEFGRVGQPFYADFTDPTTAVALEVYAFDADDVRPLEFRVTRLENGRWVIPSHHNYPADAADRLARTAASIIGVERGALVTRWPADHAQYGVVDPHQESLKIGDVEGVGKRIILRGDDGQVLADYIIGNPVEGGEKQFYVRHPAEDEVYITTLDIDLSTKFTDWIETNLLELDSWKVTELQVNDYSFDELRGTVTEREVSVLTRKDSSDPWTLAGLDDESSEVNTEAVRKTVDTLGSLKVIGVRPKQKGLTPELKLDRSVIKSQRDVDAMQSDLLTRGFLLQPGESGDPSALSLMAREGELAAATNEGLVYRLYFGRAFTGSQEELEIGFTSTSTDEAEAADDEANASDDADKDDTDDETGDDGSGSSPGRYVFVRVDFDEQYVDDKPVEPTKPEMPAALQQAEQAGDKPEGGNEAKAEPTPATTDPTSENPAPRAPEATPETGQPANADNGTADDESTCDDASEDPADDAQQSDEPAQPASEQPASADEPDASSEDPTPAEEPADAATSDDDATNGEKQTDEKPADQADPLQAIREEYEAALEKYEEDRKKYERDLESYQERVKKGREKAEELNRRFAEWYYVIPGDSYDKLSLSRDQLIKEKLPDVTGSSDSLPPGLNLPSELQPSAGATTPSTDKPQSDASDGSDAEKSGGDASTPATGKPAEAPPASSEPSTPPESPPPETATESPADSTQPVPADEPEEATNAPGETSE